jgi:cell division protein FtsB
MVGIVASLLLLLAIASLGSLRDLQAAQERLRTLEARIEEARQQNEELGHRIQRLQDDPAAIERLAREEYGMMKAGDVVLMLPAEPIAAIDVASPLTPAASSSRLESE